MTNLSNEKSRLLRFWEGVIECVRDNIHEMFHASPAMSPIDPAVLDPIIHNTDEGLQSLLRSSLLSSSPPIHFATSGNRRRVSLSSSNSTPKLWPLCPGHFSKDEEKTPFLALDFDPNVRRSVG